MIDLSEKAEKLIFDTAYELYKLDWCMQRGWKLSDVEKAYNNNEEYCGQMFVCKDEFKDCEYQDKEYIKYLFSEELK